MEYNYVTLQCHLSDSDRRTTGQYVQFVEAQGVDYFENLCIKGEFVSRIWDGCKNAVGHRIDVDCKFCLNVIGNQACKGNRVFQVPRIGVADDKVAQYAALHYYNDKELQVT